MITNLAASPYRSIEYEGETSYSPLTRTEPRISCPVTWTIRSFGTQSDRDTTHPPTRGVLRTARWLSLVTARLSMLAKNLFATLRHLRRESEDLSGFDTI